jgi:hypothetical protein
MLTGMGSEIRGIGGNRTGVVEEDDPPNTWLANPISQGNLTVLAGTEKVKLDSRKLSQQSLRF